MTEDFETMSKDDLLAYAELHSIDIDKRWSAARIREAVTMTQAKPETGFIDIEATAPATKDGEPLEAFNADALVYEWAQTFCNDINTAFAEVVDGMLVVSITTRHGSTEVRIPEIEWNAAALSEALGHIKSLITAVHS